MGIVYADIQNLIEYFRPESEGRDVITLGRLNVYFHPKEVSRLRESFAGDAEAQGYFDTYTWGDYHEGLFTQLFKCAKVDSLDFSKYEGSTIVHDLSLPITDALRNKYDLVFDGGTLEHVFNLPVAIANLIQLTRVGGLVYSNTPSNNLSGHGFYQFSPELAYRVMSGDNGMAIIFVRIGIARFPSTEMSSFHRVFDVADPALVGARVRLLSSRPAYIMFMARKIADVKLFTRPVLQSDYVKAWGGYAHQQGLVRKIFRRLPIQLQHLIMGYWHAFLSSLFNTKHYRRVRWDSFKRHHEN